MSKGFNKVVLMGNLTRDPETRSTANGQSITNFTIAVGRTWKGSDGARQEQVSYINCVAWARTGEMIAQYVSKGSPILVSGRLDQKNWEDKETGQKRSAIDVVVDDFNFISTRTSNGENSGDIKKADDVIVEDIDDNPIDLSEIPF